MAFEEALKSVTREAAADLSTRQYRFVQIDSDGRAALSGTAGRPDGVLQDKPSAAGQACAMAISGVSKVVAGAAIDEGVEVTSDSQGRAVAAGTGDEVAGVTFGAATGAGSIIPVLLKVS